MNSQTPKLTRKERDLIRKVMDQLEFGLRVAGDTLSEEELALVLKRAFDRDKIRLIESFL